MKFQVIDLTIWHFDPSKYFGKGTFHLFHALTVFCVWVVMLSFPFPLVQKLECAWLRLLNLTHWMLVLYYSILCLLREQRPKYEKLASAEIWSHEECQLWLTARRGSYHECFCWKSFWICWGNCIFLHWFPKCESFAVWCYLSAIVAYHSSESELATQESKESEVYKAD